MKRQIEFMRGSRGIGSKRTDSRTERKRIHEEGEVGKIFGRIISRVFSTSFSFARLHSYLQNRERPIVGREERKSEEHGQFANQFSIKLLDFSRPRCVFVSEDLGREYTSRPGWIPLGRRGERNTANQLANCCPLLESTTTKRFSRTSTVIQLSFSLQLCWTRRDSLEAISSKINRNGVRHSIPWNDAPFSKRGQASTVVALERSMERCQLLDSQGSSSLIVAGNQANLRGESSPKVHLVGRLQASWLVPFAECFIERLRASGIPRALHRGDVGMIERCVRKR